MRYQFDIDRDFITAMKFAKRHKGLSGENPSVGAILSYDNTYVSGACTAINGRPHAEQLLAQYVPDSWQHLDVTVTLEPCAHIGNTASCLDIIAQKKPRSITIGLQDTNHEASAALEQLRHHNITLYRPSLPLRKKTAHDVAGFLTYHAEQRPIITLKCATSLDGKIALSNGKSQWITNEHTRAYAHHQRLYYDAIISTAQSVMHDNAQLTYRAAQHKSITRIVIDKYGILQSDLALFNDIERNPVIILVPSTIKQQCRHYEEWGATLITYDTPSHNITATQIMDIAYRHKLYMVLVESGPSLLSQFIAQQLWDILYHYQAPIIIGNDGMGFLHSQHITQLDDACHAVFYEQLNLQHGDICRIYHHHRYKSIIERLSV